MGRKNEIKKDIWKILREVYGIHEARDITDKQNEFLDKVITYLDENISLRRKVVKEKASGEVEEEIPFEPLLRPEPVRLIEPVVPAEPTQKKKQKQEKKERVKAVMPAINIDALPPHLRKYAVQ